MKPKPTKKATRQRSPKGTETELARCTARQKAKGGSRQRKVNRTRPATRQRLGTSFRCMDCEKTYIECKCDVYQSANQ